MKYDRFDHEQQLMICWGVVEDLKSLGEGVLESDMTKEQISNILLGLAELYNIKFDKLWSHFEASMKKC